MSNKKKPVNLQDISRMESEKDNYYNRLVEAEGLKSANKFLSYDYTIHYNNVKSKDPALKIYQRDLKYRIENEVNGLECAKNYLMKTGQIPPSTTPEQLNTLDNLKEIDQQNKIAIKEYAKQFPREYHEFNENIDLEPEQPVEHLLNYEEESKTINSLLKKLETEENALKKTEKNIELSKQKYNEGKLKQEQFEKIDKWLNEKLQNYKNEIILLNQRIKNEHIKIGHKKEEHNKTQHENAKIQQRNKDKINKHLEEYERSTSRLTNREQHQNESTEQYLRRLGEMSKAENASREFMLKDNIDEELRNRLKTIERREYFIEAILNELTASEKVKLLKEFPAFEKQFKERYGQFNTYLTQKDLTTFIFNYLERKHQEERLKQVPENIRGFQTPQKMKLSTVDETTELYKEQLIHYYKKIGELDEMNLILIEKMANIIKFGGQYKDAFLTKKKPRHLNGNLKTIDSISKHLAEYNYERGLNIDNVMVFFETNEYSQSSSKSVEGTGMPIQCGKGIHPQNIPNKVKFGKVNIYLKKLYYDNLLSVKQGSSTMASIPQFNQAHVSNRFIQIIMDLIGGHPPTSQELSLLPSSEKILYDRLMYLSGLHKIHPHSTHETVKQLQQRMKILEGELESGNDNPVVKKELISILHTLHQFKNISFTDMKRYINQLK